MKYKMNLLSSDMKQQSCQSIIFLSMNEKLPFLLSPQYPSAQSDVTGILSYYQMSRKKHRTTLKTMSKLDIQNPMKMTN